MITFHFHLQPQYKYELFHIYFTKWRMHSNLVVNCDVVSWVSCAYRRELIKFHKAGRQAGGLAMTSHFRTTSHSRLFIYFKTCMWRTCEHVSRPCKLLWTLSPCARAVDLDSFAVKFWGWELLYLTVLSSMMLWNVRSGPRGAMFISCVHQHDRSPWFWDINRGNSCIWLHLLIFNSSSRDR